MKRKIRKFKGGGADMGDPARAQERADRGYGSTAGVDRSAVEPGSNYANNVAAQTSQTKNQFKTTDVPFSKPFGYKSQIAASLIGLGPVTAIGNLAAKQNYKARQKFAKKEGLYRDVYKTTGKVLQPNAPAGKDYLKSAGFGKNKVAPFVGNDKDSIIPISTTTKPIDPNLINPKDNFFNFVAYKVGGLSGGVKYGPPPKRGPNSQVPPVKMKKGGYKK